MSKLAQSLKITIKAKDFADKITARLEEIRKEAKLPGFRPGQAPLNMIRQKYENAVKGEVLDKAINEAVAAELTAKKLRPAMRPSVKMDKEITDALDKLAEGRKSSELLKEDRATKKGDVIVIDFVGTMDGKEFKGGTGKDAYLELGSNTFIPGFEDQLTGHKVGETVDVNVTFPKEYHAKDLAGKKAKFETKIKELRAWKKPEINDEFAKLFGSKDLADLKEMIKAELGKEYDRVASAR